MDKFDTLVKLITGCPEDITPQGLADVFNEESEAVSDLAAESNRTAGWLDYIFRFSRGKAREWAREALMSEDSAPQR